MSACKTYTSVQKSAFKPQAGFMWYASEITGLPRDTFEVREITREEFEEFRP